MRQFKTVFLYEFRNSLKNKVFLGFTIVVAALILGALIVPPIFSDLMGGGSADGDPSADEQQTAGIISIADKAGIIADDEAFEQAFAGQYLIRYTPDTTKESLLSQIEDGTIFAGLIIDENQKVTYIEDQYISSPAAELMQSALQNQMLLAGMRG